MRNALFAGVLFFLLALGGLYLFFWQMPAAVSPQADNHSVVLAPEAEEILRRNIDLIGEALGRDFAIVEALKQEGILHATLTQEEIVVLDNQWRGASDEDSLIKGLLENEVSDRLLLFQREHPEYSEIFVTDAVGLNVGQTNRTSDYYQADEVWWLMSFAEGKGYAHHGPIEFDESSQSIGVALYVPLSESGVVRGVIKAVVNLRAIERSL